MADNEQKRAASFVVLLDENSEANQKKLADLAKEHGLATPLCIALEGAKGPGAYKLNADVPLTALAYKGKKVAANLVLTAPAPTTEEAQKKEVADVIAAGSKLFTE